jgi:hypothetical protein
MGTVLVDLVCQAGLVSVCQCTTRSLNAAVHGRRTKRTGAHLAGDHLALESPP